MPVGSSTVVVDLTSGDTITAPLDAACELVTRPYVANGAVHGDTTSAISHTAENFATTALGKNRMQM